MKYESYGTLFRAELTEGIKRDGRMEIPTIERTQAIPNRLISFDKAVAAKDTDQWVHFYIHDYMFERIWRNPFRYLPILMKFNGVLSPDFSIMWNYPLHTQLESTCKSRTIGAWLQHCDIPVIPNVRWGDSRTYNFAFDGIEPG